MKLKESLRKIIEHSVVRIKVESIDMNWTLPYQIGEIRSGSGSGFFISKDLIVTCSHVVDGAKNVYLELPILGKQIMDIEVIGICPKFDIALLHSKHYKSKHWLKLGDSDKCQIGDEVMVIGYPKNYSQSKNNVNNLKYTQGIISGQQYGYIQTDSAINAGNSGGPMLINDKVIGINSRKMVGEDTDLIGYAVPINNFKVIESDFLKSSKNKNGKVVHRPALAFEYSNANQTLVQMITENPKNEKTTGILVSYIYENSPIREIGIKENDLIVSLNGKNVDNFGMVDSFWFNTKQDIFTYLNRFKTNSKIRIEYIREGKKYKKKIILKKYVPPIRMIYPLYEPVNYFIFGGMVFMNMTMNHMERNPEQLIRYMNANDIMKPKVIITFIFPNQPTSILNNFQMNDILTKINGKEIETLEDIEKQFRNLNNNKNTNKKQKREIIKMENMDKLVMYLNIEEMILNDIMLSEVYKFPIPTFHLERMKTMKTKLIKK